MRVKLKKGETTGWGMVETFQTYRYENHGTITVTAVVRGDGELAESFVYRGGDFIPASQIDNEIGIEKYIAAKKPFYMKLSDGFIVKIKAWVDYSKGKCDLSKSSFEVYSVADKDIAVNTGTLLLTRVLNVPDTMTSLMNSLIRDVADCRGKRVQYIKSRFRD